jgi:PAS domain-containing protein
MAMQKHPHEGLIVGLREQNRAILDESPQAFFIYLDDYHKFCNRKFADMLGYESPEDWAKMTTPVADSTEDTRNKLISAVMSAIEDKAASSVRIAWRTKDDRVVDTTCVSVPGMFNGQAYAMLFFEV